MTDTLRSPRHVKESTELPEDWRIAARNYERVRETGFVYIEREGWVDVSVDTSTFGNPSELPPPGTAVRVFWKESRLGGFAPHARLERY